jgi:hypothetical protein
MMTVHYIMNGDEYFKTSEAKKMLNFD